jgi:hypothetical protein
LSRHFLNICHGAFASVCDHWHWGLGSCAYCPRWQMSQTRILNRRFNRSSLEGPAGAGPPGAAAGPSLSLRLLISGLRFARDLDDLPELAIGSLSGTSDSDSDSESEPSRSHGDGIMMTRPSRRQPDPEHQAARKDRPSRQWRRRRQRRSCKDR